MAFGAIAALITPGSWSRLWVNQCIWTAVQYGFCSSVGIMCWNIHVKVPQRLSFMVYSRCLWSPSRMGEVIQTVPGFIMCLSHNCLCHAAHDKYNLWMARENVGSLLLSMPMEQYLSGGFQQRIQVTVNFQHIIPKTLLKLFELKCMLVWSRRFSMPPTSSFGRYSEFPA